MPGNKAPSAFKNLPPNIKRKAMSIFNALMRDGKSEGDAIPIAISRARKGVKEYTVKYKVISQQQIAEEDNMSDEELEELEDDEELEESSDGPNDSKDKKKKKKDGNGDDKKNGKRPNPFAKKGEDDEDEDSEKDEDGDKKKKKTKGGKAKSKEVAEIEVPVTVKLDIQIADNKMVEADMNTKVVSRASQAPQGSARKPVKLVEGARNFKLSGGFELKEEIESGTGSVWNVRCIQEGMTLNHTFYSKEVLQESANLFQGVPCFADHADDSRSVRDVVGWFENSRYEEDGVYAEFHALEATPWFLGPLKEAYSRGNTSLIGFSINGEGQRHPDKVDGHLAYIVDRIDTIESVDGVINPSAGGEVVRLVASQSREEEEELMALEKLTREELEKARPDLFAEIQDDAKMELKKKKKKKDDEEKTKEEMEEKTAGVGELKEQKTVSESAKLVEQMEKMQERMDISKCEADLKEALASNEGLPRVIKDKILAQFSGRVFKGEELAGAMTTEAEVLKALADERPTSYPAIEMGADQKDRAISALEGLIKGEDVDEVPAARTMREAYAIFHQIPTYDVDAHDVLRETWNRTYTEGNQRLREQKARLREASGVAGASGLNQPSTSAPSGFETWGEVMSELIHKRLLELYAMPYLDDWRKLATSVVAIPDFKHQRRIRVGGYGTFSSVAEAGTYATITTPTDEEATYSVTKYGQLERLTLEAIANDDVGAIRRIPEQLARGAKHTLYENLFDVFRTNTTLTYEATSIVDDGHNSGSNSLAGNATNDIVLGDASLAQAKRLLVEVTEKNSLKRLGLRGKLLLIPPELEPIAMRLQKNEFAVSATGAQGETAGSVISRERDINVHASSFEYLVIPYWANSTHWFFVADPAQVPMLEVGFYQGKQEPELFVQDMPNVGSNFDADIITYKARLIFGRVLLDHRGIIGSSEVTT